MEYVDARIESPELTEPSEAPGDPPLGVHHADVRRLSELGFRCSYRSRELARALGITPRHMQRLFALHIGCPPQEWLNQQRLLAARRMLRSARAVKEVAYKLGFRSASQLSRDFRSHFGVPPSSLLSQPTQE